MKIHILRAVMIGMIKHFGNAKVKDVCIKGDKTCP
jgi:hypothetical protein